MTGYPCCFVDFLTADSLWRESAEAVYHYPMIPTNRQKAADEFRRMMKWITVAGVLMVVGALVYLWVMDGWSKHAVTATILGVFVSMVLGCGLFALAFFSDKSGHDDDVSSATTKRKD